jgi:DNA (cytosine-5)-methyltransferase 1
MTLTHASLETGFGGFDLAAEIEGYKNVFQCEIDPFCQRLLKYHFPNADQYGDIRQFNATQYRGRINVLTAGFPCQPFSVAGTQKGVDDERFIWPENLRIIRECKPDWVILENVAGIFGVSEPTSITQMENETAFIFHQETHQETIHERVIKRIVEDLHQAGYVLPQDTKGTPIIFVVPACAVNAPHRRDRMFIVANRDGFGCDEWSNNWEKRPIQNDKIGNAKKDKRQRNGRKCRTCQISANAKRFITNYKSRNDRQHNGGTQKRQKQQFGIGTIKNPIANPNRRFRKQPKRKIQTRWQAFINGREWYLSNTKSTRLQSKCFAKSYDPKRWKIKNRQFEQFTSHVGRTLHTTDWANFPTEPPLCGGDDGLPSKLDNITFPKWRAESIKGYGNAVVVPLVQVILKNIRKVYENNLITKS